MSQTQPNGVVTITNDEVYDLSAHQARLAKSIKSVHACADLAARDGLAALYGGTLPVPTLAYRQDLDAYESWNGTVWKRMSGEETSADIATFSTGYTALTGAHKPRVRKIGNLVQLFGAVTSSASSTANILTVPAAFQPPTAGTRFIGANIASTGTNVMLALQTGIVQVPAGYGTINVTTAQTIPVMGTWWMD